MRHASLSDKELKVMMAIIHGKDEAYGASIREKILSRTGDNISYGVLYSVLDRLEQKGLINSNLGEPTAERGGRRKKFFKVSGDGQIAVNHAILKIEKMRAGLSIPELQDGEVLV
jgi:DNA-binding PadR family transcriptional regulator